MFQSAAIRLYDGWSSSKPEDARQMLIVVSSTMITVTGLVFALTIIALQIASNQYSPRRLR